MARENSAIQSPTRTASNPERNKKMMNILDGNGTKFFPPCTSEECKVDEKEKQRVATAAASKPSCELTERCVQSCAAYGRICPCAARIAAHAACDSMNELKKDSRIFPQDEDLQSKPNNSNFPYLNAEDIVIGEKLGEGGFSNVNLCVVTKGDEAGQKFAVKYLKRQAMVDLHQFKHGAADLAIEAFFLQALNHPHIVKLHGVTAGSVETNVASGKECGFFIVIDRLVDTLEERIDKWHKDQEKSGPAASRLMRLSSEYRHKKRAELLERIKIALAIAEAMKYLHSLGIVFRDLKPDNIGFDATGTLKLFDFGLAKELKPNLERGCGKYKLTGNTGSRRYMAPEVAKECPYNNSVDVYSFGILLWELCSAEKPFFGYSSGKHMQQVVIGGERPKMDGVHTAFWPANLQWLMTRCWSPFPALRPPFSAIEQVLQDILDGNESVPQSLADHPTEEQKGENVAVEAPSGGFAGFFQPLSKRMERSGTVGSAVDIEPPKDGFKGLKPSSGGSSRNRSWGFGLRR